MEEPGRLQSIGSQRVRHNWVISLHSHGVWSSWRTIEFDLLIFFNIFIFMFISDIGPYMFFLCVMSLLHFGSKVMLVLWNEFRSFPFYLRFWNSLGRIGFDSSLMFARIHLESHLVLDFYYLGVIIITDSIYQSQSVHSSEAWSLSTPSWSQLL